MERYERMQHATWMYWLAVVLLAFFVILTRGAPAAGPPLAIVSLVIAVTFAAFSRLTIAVDASAVSWSFGWGWPGGSLPLADVASVEITQTNLVEGFGIHWTIWHGWLWNAGGFQAVQITKRGGARVTLGTDDPAGLYDALVAHRKALETGDAL
jgi:hypothetical protein